MSNSEHETQQFVRKSVDGHCVVAELGVLCPFGEEVEVELLQLAHEMASGGLELVNCGLMASELDVQGHAR